MSTKSLRAYIRNAESAASGALRMVPVSIGHDVDSALIREAVQLARRLLTLARMVNEGDVINHEGYAVADAGRVDSLIAVMRDRKEAR